MKTVTIAKSAESEKPDADQLEKINAFTRRELKSEEVYVFSVILCDNEVDRDGEQFPSDSLEVLGELFIGKTSLFDHIPKAENQSARIFETRIVSESRENTLGEPYCCLKAWAYMVRCDKNADLILEIDAGIKKEVSVGCAVENVICSVCGADQKISGCGHKKGETYNGKICCHRLINPTDAYEWSFVAVPAQKNAGVTKKHKGGTFLEIEKLFNTSGEVTLTKSEIASMKIQYEELKSLADAGALYIESLRRDVVKLAALSEQGLSPALMENVTKKLSIDELKEFKTSFGKSASKGYPVSPQLGRTVEAVNSFSDNQFKI